LKSTIKDIQKKTGLSLSTISKYLNGGNVKAGNRAILDEAVSALDFKVNQFARSLKTNKSNMIGVLIPELNSTFNAALIAYMEDLLRGSGYGVIICDSRGSEDGEKRAMEFLLDKKVDGILTIPFPIRGRTLAMARKEKIPVVVIDHPVEGFESDAVIVNNRSVVRMAVNEIIGKGHLRIGMISGYDSIYTMRERRAGYREALSDGGIAYDSFLDVREEMTIAGGYNGFKQMMRQAPPPTAVFLANYELTLGAVIAMNEMGVKIGADISVIGFDNLELAKVIVPKLTVVMQPMEEISKTAVELLLKRLAAGDYPPETVMLEAWLEEGNSVNAVTQSLE